LIYFKIIIFLFCFNCFVQAAFYEFAICSMIQNEAPWIREWIEYHKLLGVDHFYLYDNESNDSIYEVLLPYIEDGIVEVFYWSTTPDHCDPRGNVFDKYQLTAFNDCIKRSKGISQFLAVIDVDEYIVPVKGKASLFSSLNAKQNKNVGSYEIHWLIYGTSHIWEIPSNKTMIEVLTKRAPDGHGWHHNTKCIHRPEAIDFCSIHNATLKPGYRKIEFSFTDVRINHYWTRDQKSWLKKRIGLSLDKMEDLAKKLPNDQYKHLIDAHEITFNRIEDRSILKFVPALKKNLLTSQKDLESQLP